MGVVSFSTINNYLEKMAKRKITKRMAIDAKRVRQSTSHPENYKYIIKIEELDGSINEVPAYGRDMEDALSGVILKERRDAVVNTLDKTPQWVIALAWFFVFGGGFAILSQLGLGLNFVVISLGCVAFFGALLFLWNKRVDNRSIEENE